jgi:heat shock protein HslJ
VVTAACGSGRAVESKAVIPRGPGNLVNTSWILVTIGATDAVPDETPFTLDIADGTASGTGPCNRYHLPFTHSGEDVTTGPVASTRVACAAPLLAAEHAYFAKLEKVDTARKEGTEDQLVLTGPDDVRLEYESADRAASDITGTWNIVNYAAADALKTPVKGTKPTLDFHSDGTLTIETGCNTGGASWRANGTSLTITSLRSTLMGCLEPPGIAEQEVAIFSALPRTASVDLGKTDAVLFDHAGSALFVLDNKT